MHLFPKFHDSTAPNHFHPSRVMMPRPWPRRTFAPQIGAASGLGTNSSVHPATAIRIAMDFVPVAISCTWYNLHLTYNLMWWFNSGYIVQSRNITYWHFYSNQLPALERAAVLACLASAWACSLEVTKSAPTPQLLGSCLHIINWA